MKLIQKGNSKISSMYMFNIPASMDICNTLCKGCYAHGEQKRYPTVLPARTARYAASQQPDFVSRVHAELASLRSRPRYFRVHASGEFYSQPYVNSWVRIAQRNPDITFYAYTKRRDDFDFSKLTALKNFVLINSLHHGRLNYGRIEKAPEGAFVCPSYEKTTKCGETCTYCMTKGAADVTGVFFKKH